MLPVDLRTKINELSTTTSLQNYRIFMNVRQISFPKKKKNERKIHSHILF